MSAARKFTDAEDDYLRSFYGQMATNAISLALNVNRKTIEFRAKTLGLAAPPRKARTAYHHVPRAVFDDTYCAPRRAPPPLPVSASDFLRAPTRAQLMAGR